MTMLNPLLLLAEPHFLKSNATFEVHNVIIHAGYVWDNTNEAVNNEFLTRVLQHENYECTP